MRRPHKIGIACAAALVLTRAGRQAAVAGELKADPSPIEYVDVRHTAREEISMAGQENKVDSTIHILFKVEKTKSTADRTDYDVTVTDCQYETETNGQKGQDGLTGIKGQKFQMTVKAGNEAVEVTVPDAMTDAVVGEGTKVMTRAQHKATGDMLGYLMRLHLIDAFMPEPGKAVSPDDTWHNEVSFDLAVGGMSETIDRQYTLGKPVPKDGKTVDPVTWTSKVEFKPLDSGGVVPFKITEIKPTDAANSGTVYLDAATHRPTLVEARQTYDMDMTMSANGETFKCHGKGDDTLTTRVTETTPDFK